MEQWLEKIAGDAFADELEKISECKQCLVDKHACKSCPKSGTCMKPENTTKNKGK